MKLGTRFFWAFLSLSMVMNIAGAEGLKEIRLYPSIEYTRLVVEGSVLPPYRMSKLENPDRLVFDVYSADGEELLEKIRTLDIEKATYLKKIRAARFNKDRLRIVFDLNDDVSFSLFSLDPVENYGHRIVLDVSPKDKESINAGLLNDLGFRKPGKPRKILVQPPNGRKQEFVVTIDAGHGGEDPGAMNSNGLLEKNIVFDIAKKVQTLLNKESRITAQLTRGGDVFLPLATRVRIAHKHNSDLFLSIHADSFTSARPRGSSVFVLSKEGASSKLAQTLAKQVNLGDMIGGINVSGESQKLNQSLTSISKDGKERASKQYAAMVKDSLANINSTHGDNVHSAGFAVLKSPSIPSVLIEVGFLSNPEDAKLLDKQAFRERLAEQIAASVLLYRSKSTSGGG